MTALDRAGLGEPAGPAVGSVIRAPHVLGLDGIRGLGALAVLVYHVIDSTWNAEAIGAVYSLSRVFGEAITVFFALSGFLIMLPFLLAAAQRTRLPRIGRYYRTRGMRIFPGYLVIFLVVNYVLAASNVRNVRDFAFSVGTITDPVTLATNLTLTQSLSPSTLSTGILPAWSLTTELGFYLVVPLLAVCVLRLLRNRGGGRWVLFLPGALFVLIGTITRVGIAVSRIGVDSAELAELSWGATWSAVLMRSTLAQADAFGYGMLAAAGIAAIMSGMLRPPRRRGTGILYAVVAVLIVASLLATKTHIPVVSGTCMGLGTAIVMFLFATATISHRAASNPLIRVLDHPVARSLGAISMSVYLWHMPIMQWLAKLGLVVESYQTLLLALAATLAITVVLSVLTYHLVEKPAWAIGRGERPWPRRRRS